MSNRSVSVADSPLLADCCVRPWRLSRRDLMAGVAAGLGLAVTRPAGRMRANASPTISRQSLTASFQVANHTAPAWQARHGLTNADYAAVFDDLGSQGYRLLDVSGYSVNGEERYTGIWEQSPGPAWVARHGLTGEDHQRAFDEFTGQGFVPTVVCGYNTGGGARFASLWEQRPHGAIDARHGISGDEFQALFDTLSTQGFIPIDLSAYVIDGQARYTVVWEQVPMASWQVTHGMLVPDLVATDNANFAVGLRPVRVSGFELDGQVWYAAIWHDRSQMNVAAEYGIPSDDYQAHFEALTRRGFRMVKTNGFPAGGTDRFTAVWHKPYLSPDDETIVTNRIQAVMNASGLPGFSVAMAKDGKLIYARGFGVANDQTGEAVTPRHLFRMASIAKPITAVMIMRLIEQGQLTLTNTVFGTNGWLGFDFGTPPDGSNIDQITIQHLLEHTTGWTRPLDPMFSFPELDQAGFIEHMVENVALATMPGAMHSYSNFGYCVLGRVIERVTGQGYAAAVQQQVLGPAGITNMHIAGDTLAERRPDEVTYTRQGDPDPYAIPVARMDAHGGWIGSPMDLLRFVTSLDGSPNRPAVISAATRATMLTPSTATGGGNYAKGWSINSGGTYWHTGGLPGMTSILVRGNNGFSWVLVTNSRPEPDWTVIDRDFDLLGWDLIRDIPDWPSTDLF